MHRLLASRAGANAGAGREPADRIGRAQGRGPRRIACVFAATRADPSRASRDDPPITDVSSMPNWRRRWFGPSRPQGRRAGSPPAQLARCCGSHRHLWRGLCASPVGDGEPSPASSIARTRLNACSPRYRGWLWHCHARDTAGDDTPYPNRGGRLEHRRR